MHRAQTVAEPRQQLRKQHRAAAKKRRNDLFHKIMKECRSKKQVQVTTTKTIISIELYISQVYYSVDISTIYYTCRHLFGLENRESLAYESISPGSMQRRDCLSKAREWVGQATKRELRSDSIAKPNWAEQGSWQEGNVRASESREAR